MNLQTETTVARNSGRLDHKRAFRNEGKGMELKKKKRTSDVDIVWKRFAANGITGGKMRSKVAPAQTVETVFGVLNNSNYLATFCC